jgi:hypothetical protein
MKSEMTRIITLLVTAGCSFWLGRLVATSFSIVSSSLEDAGAPILLWKIDIDPLEQQIKDQELVQSLIFKSQHPLHCDAARFLVRDRKIAHKDGFASDFQYMARLLQSAISTHRTLFISRDWKSAYAPHSCQDGGWTCLWRPISNCIKASGSKKATKNNVTSFESSLSLGILPKKQRRPDTTSSWFDPLYYGSRAILPAPFSFPLTHTTKLIDVLPHWERVYGRFWVRAQMAYYLWKPSEWLQNEMEQRLHKAPINTPYIGMHIRFTDNIPDLAKSFGRNATITRSLDRFVQVADRIRQQHPTIRTIYLATDHAQMVEWAQKQYTQWTWVSQLQVQRTTTNNRMWFAQGRSTAGAEMATDLHLLKQADYLIGSFQSNVFRLAAQLNTAHNVDRYSVRQRRHFTVDVEWFEDP